MAEYYPAGSEEAPVTDRDYAWLIVKHTVRLMLYVTFLSGVICIAVVIAEIMGSDESPDMPGVPPGPKLQAEQKKKKDPEEEKEDDEDEVDESGNGSESQESE